MNPASRQWALDLLALAAGAIFVFSLSPFDIWPLAFLTPGLLFVVTASASVKRSLLRFYLYNLGMFGFGASWIYVSVHVYGYAPPWLAVALVALLVACYSLIALPQAWLYAKFGRQNRLTMVTSFTALWVLQEWIRTWFLTGFPWLYQGYGVMETPVAAYAPIAGVFAVSLVVVLCSVLWLEAALNRKPVLLLAGLVLSSAGLLLKQVEWTAPAGRVSVSLVQANVDQHVKWRPENRLPILQKYLQASQSEWGRSVVIWPEAAVTIFREQAETYLNQLDQVAAESGTTLLLGIPDRNKAGGFLNTVVALGRGEGAYIKRRLVPFGEYVPMENLLRGIIRILDLPMSRNHSGPADQAPIRAGDLTISTSICYEVIYPELVRNATKSPDLLVTVSNDTWFGASIGPWQHLQMARMRALENGRPMARATNNGVTALIDHRGTILSSLPQFEQGVLRGELALRDGETPFHRFGQLPVLVICALLLLPLVAGRLFNPE